MTRAELIAALAALPFEEQAEVFRQVVGFQIACCPGCGCYLGAPWCHPVADAVELRAYGECASQCPTEAELAAHMADVEAAEAQRQAEADAVDESRREEADEARREEADAAHVSWQEYYGPRERSEYDRSDDEEDAWPADEPPEYEWDDDEGDAGPSNEEKDDWPAGQSDSPSSPRGSAMPTMSPEEAEQHKRRAVDDRVVPADDGDELPF